MKQARSFCNTHLTLSDFLDGGTSTTQRKSILAGEICDYVQILWYFCYGFAPRLVRHPFLYGEVPEGAGVKNMNFNETYMKDLLKQWGKHVVALILFFWDW